MQQDSLPARSKLAELHPEALRALGGSGTRQQVVAKALQIGHFTESQRVIPSPAVDKYYRTKLEYELNHALTLAKDAGLIEHPRRDWWTLPGDVAN